MYFNFIIKQRENILGKKNRQSIRKGIIQLIHNAITVFTIVNIKDREFNYCTASNDC